MAKPILTFVLILVAVIAPASAAAPSSTQTALVVHQVDGRKPTNLVATGARVRRDFGAMAIVEFDKGASAAVEKALREQRFQYSSGEHLYQISAGSGLTIDVRRDPAIEPPASVEEGLFVVQFDAPASEDRLPALRTAVGAVLTYVSHDAYLVHANRAQIAQLRKNPSVQWVSYWDAMFKAAPDLNAATTTRFRIITNRSSKLPIELQEQRVTTQIAEIDTYLAISVDMPYGEATALLSHPDVVAIEEQGTNHPSGERAALGMTQTTFQGNAYRSWLGGAYVLDTSSFTIAIADTGLAGGWPGTSPGTTTSTQHPDFLNQANKVTWKSFVTSETPNQNGYAHDFDGHGTAVASVALGDPVFTLWAQDPSYFWYSLGVAPRTRIHVQKIFDDSFNRAGSVDSWLQDAIDNDAIVQSQSRNTYSLSHGYYTADDVAYDREIREQDLPMTVSAGNIYPSGSWATPQVFTPGTAKNPITLGAAESVRPMTPGWQCRTEAQASTPAIWTTADSFNNIAYMSRRGTRDGRNKPDLVAPGTLVSAARWPGRPSGWCLHVDPPDGVSNYLISSGTSFASPQAAAAIALIQQKRGVYTAMSAAMAKAALVGNALSIKGGTDKYTNTTVGARPDNATGQGWGRLNLQSFLYGNETHTFRDGRQPSFGFLTPLGFTGDYREETYRVVDQTKPVTIVLAWSDEPGTTGTGRTLKNDLDLLIPSGGQIIYAGNTFDSQEYSWNWANIGPVPVDQLNNVEVIRLSPGTLAGNPFTVRVLMRDFGGTTFPTQPFSLYVRNACTGC